MPSKCRARMQDDRLQDRHVVVTGAAMGIGKGIATRCARAGANVTILDRVQEEALETADEIREIGGGANVVELELTDFSDYDRALDSATQTFGPIHGLVNNAGVQEQVPALAATTEDWDWHFDVDAKAPFFLAQHVAQHMIDNDIRGGIVTIASSAEDLTYPGQAIYRAAKRSVHGFSTVLAKEVGDHGIRVNTINPGGVVTPMFEQAVKEMKEETGLSETELKQQNLDDHILNRFGEPEEIGNMVVLLLSDEGEWITGASIPVDGGQSV